MKYSTNNSIILGIVILVIFICFAGNFSDNPEDNPDLMKAKTETGKDTLITVKN